MRPFSDLLSPLLLSVLLLPFSGCARSGSDVTEVRGTVSYQGKALPQGVVLFQPAAQSTGSRPAVGEITADGTYEMSAFPSQKGVLPGEYRVSIDAHTGSFINNNVVYIAPKRYADPNTSGLTATVPAVGSEPLLLDFTLTD